MHFRPLLLMSPIKIINDPSPFELPDEDAWANAAVEKNVSVAAVTRSLFIVLIVCIAFSSMDSMRVSPFGTVALYRPTRTT